MAELIREIEAADIPKLRDLMKLVFGDSEWEDIRRLGGMTNHSYKITRTDGQEYLVRIPGDGTEEMINRLDEQFLAEVRAKGDYVFSALRGAEGVESVSGMGLMIGIKPKKSAGEVLSLCRANGVLCLTAKDRVRLLPALNIPMELLEKAVAVIKAACA